MQDTGALYGAERATLELARGLRAAGEAPVFLLLEEARLRGRSSAFRAALETEALPVHSIPIRGRCSLAAAREVRSRFDEIGRAVLHVTGYKACLHAWMSGVRPVAATVHGWLFRPDVKEQFYGMIERFCLRRFDRVVCLSSFYEDLLIRAGIRRERLVRIPTGLNQNAIPPMEQCTAPPPVPFTFLLAGRFSEEKNHALLLRACARLSREKLHVRVLLAGEGPLRSRLERSVVELHVSDHVRFVGYVPMAELLPQAHALVLCSTIENLPLSILEAMAWARPVVATRVGGIPDLVEDGKTGLLVPSDDDAALAEAMRCLIAEPARAAEWGRAGRARVESQFTMERMVAAHVALYREIATHAA